MKIKRLVLVVAAFLLMATTLSAQSYPKNTLMSGEWITHAITTSDCSTVSYGDSTEISDDYRQVVFLFSIAEFGIGTGIRTAADSTGDSLWATVSYYNSRDGSDWTLIDTSSTDTLGTVDTSIIDLSAVDAYYGAHWMANVELHSNDSSIVPATVTDSVKPLINVETKRAK